MQGLQQQLQATGHNGTHEQQLKLLAPLSLKYSGGHLLRLPQLLQKLQQMPYSMQTVAQEFQHRCSLLVMRCLPTFSKPWTQQLHCLQQQPGNSSMPTIPAATMVALRPLLLVPP